ncbi:MAG: site-specific integrase [Candidatus Micrarchaeota archaeon]
MSVSRNENCGFSVLGCQFPDCSKAQPSRKAKQISKLLTGNWKQIELELGFLGRYLTKWNLVKAIALLSEARKCRFLRRKTPKYGSMNKGFTNEELERFFSVIDDHKMHLLFSFQAILGLRIGEAIRINIKDLNLKNRDLRIETEKSGKTDYLLMPQKLFDATIQYINSYETEVAKAGGFLFFSLSSGNRKQGTENHLSSETVRGLFRDYARKAKLQETYAYSSGSSPRNLYRLSPHSLRHYAITNFCRKNGGNVMLSSKFARHNSLQSTMVYIHTEKQELYEGIDKAQNDDLLEKVRKMQEKV